MIPRRRIPFDAADLSAWLAAPFTPPDRAHARVRAFEQAFAACVGVRHALAAASGRDALSLIVDGLGLQAGDELIIPAYTLGELLPLLQGRRLELVPADIDPVTYNMTAAAVRACAGPRTRAILAVHLLGAPCDIRGICRVGDELGVPVIEDCAHAPGARVEGRHVGSFGHAALFSLEATKAVSAFGGGVLATDDDRLAAHVRQALDRRPRSEWPLLRKSLFKWIEELGVRSPLYGPLARLLFADRRAGGFDRFYRRANDRVRAHVGFSGYQARLALRRLARLDTRTRELNRLWDTLAGRLPPRFQTQRRSDFGDPAFYNFVALFDGDVARLRRAAQERGLDLGIGAEVMDDTARLLGRTDCPGAAHVHRHAVLIPLYAGMTPARLERVIERLHAAAAEVP